MATNWEPIATKLYEALRSFTAYDGYGQGGAADANKGDWPTAAKAEDDYNYALRTMEVLPVNQRTGEVKDTSLTDDLAYVLASVVVGWEDKLGVDLAQHPEVQRVMARYRQAKADQEKLAITLQIKTEEVNAVFDQQAEVQRARTEQKPHIGDAVFDHSKGGDLWSQWADVGRQVEQDCNVFGMSLWERIEGVIKRIDPTNVAFTVRLPDEIPPGGSFPAHKVSEWERPHPPMNPGLF